MKNQIIKIFSIKKSHFLLIILLLCSIVILIISVSIYFSNNENNNSDIISVERMYFINSSGEYSLNIIISNHNASNISCVYAYTLRDPGSKEIVANGNGSFEIQSYGEFHIKSIPQAVNKFLWECATDGTGGLPVVSISIRDDNGKKIGSSRQQISMEG